MVGKTAAGQPERVPALTKGNHRGFPDQGGRREERLSDARTIAQR